MRLPMRKRVAACLLHFVYVPFQTVAGSVTGRKASLRERNLVPSWSNRKQLLGTIYYRTFQGLEKMANQDGKLPTDERVLKSQCLNPPISLSDSRAVDNNCCGTSLFKFCSCVFFSGSSCSNAADGTTQGGGCVRCGRETQSRCLKRSFLEGGKN